MFFNYDSFEIMAIGFVVLGILTYSWSYKAGHFNGNATINNESLINTKSLSIDPTHLNSDSNISTLNTTAPTTHSPTLDSINLPIRQLHVDVSVQVDQVVQASTLVNTGMQTSARMWMQTIRDWINELLSTAPANPNYVDVGVQATPVLEHASRWQSFKDWVLECFSMRSSEYSSIGARGVEKWRNGLDSIQSLDLHDSESPLECTRALTPSSLQQLVGPDDSGSQVSEVVSEAELQNVENVTRVYDMSNVKDVLELMNDPTVVMSINSATLPHDDLITFYTADSANEIVRSTLEALLNGVN